jgi:hypothetical protein
MDINMSDVFIAFVCATLAVFTWGLLVLSDWLLGGHK